jgi:hypothetical protein
MLTNSFLGFFSSVVCQKTRDREISRKKEKTVKNTYKNSFISLSLTPVGRVSYSRFFHIHPSLENYFSYTVISS